MFFYYIYLFYINIYIIWSRWWSGVREGEVDVLDVEDGEGKFMWLGWYRRRKGGCG
jgi:hypothetical protein